MPSKYVKTPGGIFVPGEQYTYESSEIFLSMVQAEYQREIDRASVLDSKLSISVPVISAYFLLIIQDSSVKDLLLSISGNEYSLKIMWTLALYLMVTFTAVCSLLFTVHAVMTRSYEVIDLSVFYAADVLSRPKEQFSAVMSGVYSLAAERNRQQNNRKARDYQLGWIFGTVSLYAYFLYVFFTG
ncbi:MAG: hypothetical protein IKN96_03220 [Oscillibacter sp.]|nr:hypothetical protein [Oscillibacter sp.]